MKGDRVEAVVDTGQGVQTFEIVATRAGRRIEVTTARGVVEVTEVTRGGNPVRTGRFMASRLVALVEHPAIEGDGSRVDVTTRRRMSTGEGRDATRGGRAAEEGSGGRAAPGRGRRGSRDVAPAEAAEAAAEGHPEPLGLLLEEEATAVDPVDLVREAEQEPVEP
jgi:hypothetical protein